MGAGAVKLVLFKPLEIPLIPVTVANDFRVFDLALQHRIYQWEQLRLTFFLRSLTQSPC